MKTSIKLSAILLAIFGLSSAAQAQTAPVKYSEGIIYSLGVESGVSAGNFKNDHKWTFGGSFQADVPLSENLYVNANAGYTNFYGKNSKADIHMIPVMAGIKYFPVSLFYVQADAGAGILLNKADLGYQQTTAFLYAPQVGVQFPVGGGNSMIDLGIRYQGTTKYTSNVADSKINYFGIRLAYAISTK